MDYDDEDDESRFDTSKNDYEEEVTPIECPSCGEELDPATCTGVCPECGEEVEIPPEEEGEENVELDDLIGEDEEVEKIISNSEDIPAEDLVDEDYADKSDEGTEEEEEEEEEEAKEEEDEESYYYE